MLSQNQIITFLQRLTHLDAYIFLFYYNELLRTDNRFYWPSKVGSRVHFECLKRQAEASDIPYITDEILPEIERIKLNTFSGKSKRMVSMAEMSRKSGVNPHDYLPSTIVNSDPSLSKAISSGLKKQGKMTLDSPYVQTKFDWYDHNHRPAPVIVEVFAQRVLLPDVVTAEDCTFSWLTSTKLLVKTRYPDLINFPVELCALVEDDKGNVIFSDQHPAVVGFDKDLAGRREMDGYVYSSYCIEFEKPQEPQFVKLNQFLSGFDVLRAKYSNKDNECFSFKMLQIVTKEKSESKGSADSASYTRVLRSNQVYTSVPSNMTFASPTQVKSHPIQSPVFSPTPVKSHPSQSPLFVPSNDPMEFEHSNESLNPRGSTPKEAKLEEDLHNLNVRFQILMKTAEEREREKNEMERNFQQRHSLDAEEKIRFEAAMIEERTRLENVVASTIAEQKSRLETAFLSEMASEKARLESITADERARLELITAKERASEKARVAEELARLEAERQNLQLEAKERASDHQNLHHQYDREVAVVERKKAVVEEKERSIDAAELEKIKHAEEKIPKRTRQSWN